MSYQCRRCVKPQQLATQVRADPQGAEQLGLNPRINGWTSSPRSLHSGRFPDRGPPCPSLRVVRSNANSTPAWWSVLMRALPAECSPQLDASPGRTCYLFRRWKLLAQARPLPYACGIPARMQTRRFCEAMFRIGAAHIQRSWANQRTASGECWQPSTPSCHGFERHLCSHGMRQVETRGALHDEKTTCAA